MTWKANKRYGLYSSELMWICKECGYQVMHLSEYCPHCGIKTGIKDTKDRALVEAAVLIKENCIEKTNNELDCPGCIFFESNLKSITSCKLAAFESNDQIQFPEDWEV